MDLANHFILVSSLLILFSILAGMASSRFGAPLLLVFLVLGMLAGEDGPGGIEFDNFGLTYLIGSIALAIILFDGGLRTRWAEFRTVFAPAVVLATVGVLITAALTGTAARYLMGVEWLEGMLIGCIVASTDAAAVFLLLHLRGMRLRDRLRSVLEAEAGLNDPMAILLTVTCVTLISASEVAVPAAAVDLVLRGFALQMGGGIVIGVIGGLILIAIINRLNIVSGLYPILVTASVLALFAGAQEVGASGFLAAYLAGLVVGNRRHRATLITNRFHDGLAWLCQISMFLILGLLVTPTALFESLVPGIGIAFVLIFLARPAAVALCLPAFRFNLREIAFVSWVGLRGGVPIFLATIPVLAGVEDAQNYFGVVFVVVMISLIVQGWTVGLAGRHLSVMLPPRPTVPPRFEIDMPSEAGRNLIAYAVQPDSLALKRPLARLPLPGDIDLISVLRDGVLRTPNAVAHLSPGDDILLMAPTERLEFLDRLFGARAASTLSTELDLTGEFLFGGEVLVGAIAETYGFALPPNQRNVSVADFLHRHLIGWAMAGRRLRLGRIELVVHKVERGRITGVSVELQPGELSFHRFDPLHVWARSLFWIPVAGRFARAVRLMAKASRKIFRTRL